MQNIIKGISNKAKIGINSNTLKLIALICMIVDHIGYYMYFEMGTISNITLRSIGRLAMPIFVFLLVQGFFHTKNLKKYILRMFCLAVATQLGTSFIEIITKKMKSVYEVNINSYLNIVFSFVLTLILMYIFYEKKIIKKWDINNNIFLKIILTISIIGIYVFVPIDYGMRVPFIGIMLYFVEKFRISIYMNKKSGNNFSVSGFILDSIKEETIKKIYMLAIVIVLLMSLRFATGPMWLALISIVAILPISLYNGTKGAKNKLVDLSFYIAFPLQHILLYLVAIIIKCR